MEDRRTLLGLELRLGLEHLVARQLAKAFGASKKDGIGVGLRKAEGDGDEACA